MITPHIGPRLLALFAAGVLLLNFPLLALWDREATVFGLPLFPLALFGIWAGLIAWLAWLLERGERGERSSSSGSSGSGSSGSSGSSGAGD